MIAALREWLLGVTVCAVAAALARELATEGAAKEAVRFAGGLLVLLSLLKPLAAAQLPQTQEIFSTVSAAEQEEAYRAVYRQALADDIAARTAAYIEDKARGIGLSVRAEVFVSTDETPLPTGVTLDGAYSAVLTEMLIQELGLEQGSVIWTQDDGSIC